MGPISICPILLIRTAVDFRSNHDLVHPHNGSLGSLLHMLAVLKDVHASVGHASSKWCTCIMDVFVFILFMILMNAMCLYRMMPWHVAL